MSATKLIDTLVKAKEWSLVNGPLKGGNADVYLCRTKEGEDVAVKFLRRNDKEAIERFKREITFLQLHKDVDGILPLLDTDGNTWYSMPKAMAIFDFTKNCTPQKILLLFLTLCTTVAKLHDLDISHRDIKPDNLYWYKDHVCLSDFGLMKDESVPGHLTTDERGVGAIFTIAPEMMRYPKEADPKKGDVYSVAKTLWILLTHEEKGFDGTYIGMNEHVGLRFFAHLEKEYLAMVERLLTKATSFTPDDRPSMLEFSSYLLQAIQIQGDSGKAVVAEWSYIQDLLSPSRKVRTLVWTNLDEIVRVMNVVGRAKAANHMMFASGGGLDFRGVERAGEEGCLKMHIAAAFPAIIKPKALYYECFAKANWHYFLLELNEIKPMYLPDEREEELVLEEAPGKYAPLGDAIPYWVYDYDKGNVIPKTTKIVNRILNGRMLIITKASDYNYISETYDGRHGNCTIQEFRDYMDEGFEKGLNNIDCPFIPSKDEEPNPELMQEFEANQQKEALIREGFLCLKNPLIESVKDANCMAEFFVEFRPPQKIDFSSCSSPKTFYLGKDGLLTCTQEADCYRLYDRTSAEQQCRVIIHQMQRRFDLESDELIRHCVKLHIQRIGLPHLQFKRDIVLKLLKESDDRMGNKLVVDEMGCPHRLVAPFTPWMTYPCESRTFYARHNECGPYSDYTHNKVYEELLARWAMYLRTGQECPYVLPDEDEKVLLKRIEKYERLISAEYNR